MLTHAEINRRFIQLDHNPLLLNLKVDGWLAWPVVKERVWLYCLTQVERERETRKSVYSLGSLKRIFSGIAQFALNIGLPRQCDFALLYEERDTRLPNGQIVHPHLGTLPTRPSGGSYFHYLYVWDANVTERIGRSRMSDRDVGAFAALVARIIRRCKSITSLARLLRDEIGVRLPEIDSEQLYLIIADQLARFRVRSVLFSWIFRRNGIGKIIVLDPDGKVPEIAAAKRLGLEVVEVQHGMFSAVEPDYSWSEVHRNSSTPLPVPDKVIVFGPLWRDELLKAGYWQEDEIFLAQNPVLDAFRRVRHERNTQKSSCRPLNVLFPAQPHLRDAAFSFWYAVLDKQNKGLQDGNAPEFHLRIKPHPLELGKLDQYRKLSEAFPSHCTLAVEGSDAFYEMLDSDIVAGFTSLMMIEALGLEIPVINLKCGPESEGFWETFQISNRENVMCECIGPNDFESVMKKCAKEGHSGARLDIACSIHQLEGPSVESILS